MAEVVKLIV